MAEYIEKEDIEQKIQLGLNNLVLGHDAIEILGMIYEMPAAYVAPVRHGWWVHEHISEGYAWVICSECEAVIHKILINKRLNYCPNCGAKMDGGKNDVHQN